MAMPGDPRSFTAVPPKRDEDKEVLARPRTRTERARSMRKSLKVEKKMKAPVGSKKKKEEEEEEKKMKNEKKMKTEETPDQVEETKTVVLSTTNEGYDGPTFEKVEERYTVDPSSGKRKKERVVRLSKGLLQHMAQLPPRQPKQRFPLMDPRLRAIDEWRVALDKAACEEREDILKQYEDHGYAEVISEITDTDTDDDDTNDTDTDE